MRRTYVLSRVRALKKRHSASRCVAVDGEDLDDAPRPRPTRRVSRPFAWHPYFHDDCDVDAPDVPPQRPSRRQSSEALFAALRKELLTAAVPPGQHPQRQQQRSAFLPDDFIARFITGPSAAAALAGTPRGNAASNSSSLRGGRRQRNPVVLGDGTSIPRLRVKPSSGLSAFGGGEEPARHATAASPARVSARWVPPDPQVLRSIPLRVLTEVKAGSSPAAASEAPTRIGNPALDALFAPGRRDALFGDPRRYDDGAAVAPSSTPQAEEGRTVPLREGVRAVAARLAAARPLPTTLTTTDALTFRRPLLEGAAQRRSVGAHIDAAAASTVGMIGYRAAIERLALSEIDDERQHGRAQQHEDTANQTLERGPQPATTAAKPTPLERTFDDANIADLAGEVCPVTSSQPITEDELIEALTPAAAHQRKGLGTTTTPTTLVFGPGSPELAEHEPAMQEEGVEHFLEIGPPAWPRHADANEGSGKPTGDHETRASIGRALLATKAFEVVMDNVSWELRALHGVLVGASFFDACGGPDGIPPATFAELESGTHAVRRKSAATSRQRPAPPKLRKDLCLAFEAFAEKEAPLLEDLPKSRKVTLLWIAWRLHRLRAALAAFVEHVVFEGSRGETNDAQRLMAALGLHTTDVASPTSADDDFARSARFDFRASFLLGVVRDAVRDKLGGHPL